MVVLVQFEALFDRKTEDYDDQKSRNCPTEGAIEVLLALQSQGQLIATDLGE